MNRVIGFAVLWFVCLPCFGAMSFNGRIETEGSFADWSAASEVVFKEPISQKTFSKTHLPLNSRIIIGLFGEDALISFLGGARPRDLEAALQGRLRSFRNLGEFAEDFSRHVGISANETLRAFFEPTEAYPSNRGRAFISRVRFRSEFLKGMAYRKAGMFLSECARQMFDRIQAKGLTENLLVSLSFRTQYLESRDSRRAIMDIPFFGADRRVTVQLIAEMSRKSLSDPGLSNSEFNRRIGMAQEMIRRGVANGFQLWESGAEMKDILEAQGNPVLGAERMKRLLSMLGSLQSELKRPVNFIIDMHPDGTRDKTFYDTLFSELEALARTGNLPGILSIGNAEGMNEETIERIKKVRASVPADSKPPSIKFLMAPEMAVAHRGYTYEDLAVITGALLEEGFGVLMSDRGRGVLGEGANFVSMVEKLVDAGLSVEHRDQLIRYAAKRYRGINPKNPNLEGVIDLMTAKFEGAPVGACLAGAAA